MRRVKILFFAIPISALLCGCSGSDFSEVNQSNNSIPVSSESIYLYTDTGEEQTDILEGNDIDMDNTKVVLPEEAENALLEYLKCDSIETLSDSILPSSVADEMKNGTLQQGNYFFAGFPCGSYNDEEISECTRMPKQQAENLAAFWAGGVSIQGVSVDFTAEEGYDVVASATYEFKDNVETIKIRVTKRLNILKIIDDRWIIIPTADMETNKMEIIQ